MKKLFRLKNLAIFLPLFFGLSSIATASIEQHKTVIFNMNNKYDIQVTYQACSYDFQNNKTCANQNTITVKAKKQSNDENFVVLTQHEMPGPEIRFISVEIMSAEEKDESGRIIAQQKYIDASRNINSNCAGSLYVNNPENHPHVGDIALAFNDMHESPFIVCNGTTFSENP